MQIDRRRLEEELQRFERYRIDSSRIVNHDVILGTGGFGSVERGALQPDLTTFVAIKRLHSLDVSMNLTVAVRLVREMAVWAELCHANIVKFLGFYLSDTYDVACLILDYAQYGPITSYLSKTEANDTRRLELVLHTIEGLKYLHCSDPAIYHGDLKASNILVNGQGHAVLCDLGLAKALSPDHSGYTTSDIFKGSHRWCSPEVLNGKPRSLESDIWSWACSVLEVRATIY
ncbi:Tyrosine-protein kinase ZAP-70 [Tulasnella sp. JGI-2019a]|nr:Tyrosine-protein kinase ZAP-70 [Tulasnella sp. JGI-2019a]